MVFGLGTKNGPNDCAPFIVVPSESQISP